MRRGTWNRKKKEKEAGTKRCKAEHLEEMEKKRDDPREATGRHRQRMAGQN